MWAALVVTPMLAVPLRIDGPSTYELQADGATIRITTTFTNTGATTSAALQLQLWAFATPYNPNSPPASGYRLATVNLAALPAGAAYTNISPVAPFSPPAAGVWNIVLFAEEETGGAFVIRTFFNFADTLPVAGSLAVYSPGAVQGVPNPATLRNLLVDASRLYWTHVEAGSIDTVGLTPGSAPGVLAAFGGGFGNQITMVQDSLNLYALRQTALTNGEIIKVVKTSGTSTRLATSAPNLDGPRTGPIGIQPQGGTLYFPAYQNLPVNINFIGSYMSQMSTQGGTITHYGATPPIDDRAEQTNVSAVFFAVDFTNVYWIEGWDRTLRQMPLIGGASSTVLVPNLSVGANFLSAPADGPAGGSLFWIDGVHPNRALKRRKVGGQVITVIGDVFSDSYAIDGNQVYLVSGVVGQANLQLCSVPIDGGVPRALLSVLDTGVPGEIVTDGNAIYWVSIDTSLNTRIKKLVLPVAGTPLVTQQPRSQHVAPGANVQFTALASSGGISQIWYRNGEALVPKTVLAGGPTAGSDPPRAASVVTSSAGTPTLTLTNVTAADMGFYSCVVTNSAGTTQTAVAILTVDTGGPSRLINLSTRGQVQAGAALTPGFVMKGTGGKQLLIRAVGPTLSVFGLAALSDTKMEVINQQTSTQAAANDDWSPSLATTFSSLGAFALTANSKDAATLSTLPVNQGGYTVRITASGSATSGLALAEVYDADPITAPAKLANVSTLGFAGTGADALTPGFVIGGTAPKQLLIRAIGPGLAPFGVGGTLADPRLAVIPLGMNLTAASNDDWGGTAELKAAFAAAGAFSIPDGTKDAALVVRLPPGGYSAVVSGANGTTGNVLVEVYDLDP